MSRCEYCETMLPNSVHEYDCIYINVIKPLEDMNAELLETLEKVHFMRGSLTAAEFDDIAKLIAKVKGDANDQS